MSSIINFAYEMWANDISLEKYSSGWRGAPAKGIDGLRRARVQIPPSPFLFLKKTWKKFLTKKETFDIISELRLTENKNFEKEILKKLKKFLTRWKQHDRI